MKIKKSKLTHEIVSDCAALVRAIDQVLQEDRGVRRLGRGIKRPQQALRAAVDDDGWRCYLRVEEVVNERAARQTLVLVRWAYAQGVCAGRGQR